MEALMQFHGIVDCNALSLIIAVVVALGIGFFGLPFFVWYLAILAGSIVFGLPTAVTIGLAVVLGIFVVPPLRKVLVTSVVMKVMKGVMPKISDTERTALEAGVVWAESDLFSGKPNFKKLVKEPYAELNAEEKAFIDGPVEELCSLIDDWEVWRKRELPAAAMDFIKKEKFLGMIVPKEYGGLGFSALAHADVIAKLSTRSVTAGITVMVPNSLGPAELLIHYGTEEQKKHWLPKLASGEVVPCFGLTEPPAGSDAGAIQATGVLFKGDDGRIKIKMNWNKRWITLAAISDVLGIAFKLKDPDGLIGDKEDVGITCALVPSKTEGVVIGRRHDPLNVPFYNCPTQGHDVVVDAEDAIIGGVQGGAGEGWKMLMESLGAGRGISLPSQSAGGLKYISRVASNHAMIRKQFGVSIGQFEGVHEPLARIFAQNYYVDAMRRYTLGAIDGGISPPVITAICKFQTTEAYRRGINDGMDVLGGAGISLGPKNLLATGYMAAPISITVEGANILTRTLMIFGQGALRAHPYAYKEVAAVEKGDLTAFDNAFWGHIGHITRNLCRSAVLSVSRGKLGTSPVGGPLSGCWKRLSWASASFAILADMAMGLMGGSLKFREKITGRFVDILSWMFIGLSILRRWEAEGRKKEDLPVVHVAMWYVFNNIQIAFDGIFRNFDVPVIGLLFKGPVRWWSRFNRIDWELRDETTAAAVQIFLQDSEQRDRLTDGIYIPQDESQVFARQEKTFKAVLGAAVVGRKVRKAIRKKILPKKPFSQILDEAVEKSVITAEEKTLLKSAEDMRNEAIQVDDFSEEEFRSRA